MNRITEKTDKEYFIPKDKINDATKRLAEYENMQESAETEYSYVCQRLEKMRSDGKTKTITYKQLFAQKLTLMNWLSRFKTYGL